MTIKIAGIGSRKTPKEICAAMFEVGTWCNINNITVRSGHADGADWAFESGAQERCIAYIPWEGFNYKLVSKAAVVVPDFTKGLMELAELYHPAWGRLSYGAKKLIARNVSQVLGDDVKSPVDAIVCWTKDAKVVGGTGQALRIAKFYQIPIINMAKEEYNTGDKVIEELKIIAGA